MKLKCVLLFLITVFVLSCDKNDDDDYEFIQVATPELMSKAAFRNSVKVSAPKAITTVGKIYAFEDYIFVGDVGSGIHVIDNSDPKSPNTVSFIEIFGNEDISIKDDFLYADSATDLVVFDISDLNNISVVERLEDVFNVYNYDYPIEANAIDFGDYDVEETIIVGWTLSIERRKKMDENDIDITGVLSNASAESSIGTGETMFQADGYLYLGSTRGMYIYSLLNPASPEFVSEFVHWEGCDPVVVDGDYAYLTLRGGNLCGQLESVLEVIDIKDKSNPSLVNRYTLDNPYGLGVKGNQLYVCDGTAGLKIFKRETPKDLKMVTRLENVQAKDVIPLENKLLMIGGNTLYQYAYKENNVELISSYLLN